MTSFRSKKNVNPTGDPYTAEIVAITPKVHLKSLKTGSNKGLKDAVLASNLIDYFYRYITLFR